MKTTIQKIDAKPGQRIIAMSDIHGHLDHMVQLLRKVHYSRGDLLVIVGDLVDKGPDSLRTVRYIMDLSADNQVYVSEGNVDEHRLQFLCDNSEGNAERFCDFVHWLQEHRGCGLLLDMLAGLGISAEHLTPENAESCKNRLLEHYAPEIAFLRQLPTILDMGSYLFVHGGIPTDDLESLLETDRHGWLKNDRFMEKGYRFTRCVVTGHWPVSLYNHEEEQMNPVFDYSNRIISMDGGCGLQTAGQLNALIFPDRNADMREITCEYYDGFPVVTALDRQEKTPHSLYIQYFDSAVEKLEERDGMILCRHLSSKKELWVPSCFLYQEDNGSWHVDNYNDAALEANPGDRISAIYRNASGCYGKRNGIPGWYYGRFAETEMPAPMKLIPGRPKEEKGRMARERAVYDLLDRLGISYSHIDHQEARTLKACEQIDEILDAVICKNLFLRNQQATRFYLLMMPGDKKFKTKELSKQIGSARLSFAEAEYMERFLHISPGSVSVMGLMNDTENQVQLLIDRDIQNGKFFGCHPCVNTSSIRLRLKDLLERILPAIHHEAIWVELKEE